ncbi:uncharacterized protein LOC117119256, partial [Anneissia japonica]|uniref:uncharacterized protein LOC117119256 n=1 Tax=Anneissia japonica TaxID=1529436 RepID=UPI0014255081
SSSNNNNNNNNNNNDNNTNSMIQKSLKRKPATLKCFIADIEWGLKLMLCIAGNEIDNQEDNQKVKQEENQKDNQEDSKKENPEKNQNDYQEDNQKNDLENNQKEFKENNQKDNQEYIQEDNQKDSKEYNQEDNLKESQEYNQEYNQNESQEHNEEDSQDYSPKDLNNSQEYSQEDSQMDIQEDNLKDSHECNQEENLKESQEYNQEYNQNNYSQEHNEEDSQDYSPKDLNNSQEYSQEDSQMDIQEDNLKDSHECNQEENLKESQEYNQEYNQNNYSQEDNEEDSQYDNRKDSQEDNQEDNKNDRQGYNQNHNQNIGQENSRVENQKECQEDNQKDSQKDNQEDSQEQEDNQKDSQEYNQEDSLKDSQQYNQEENQIVNKKKSEDIEKKILEDQVIQNSKNDIEYNNQEDNQEESNKAIKGQQENFGRGYLSFVGSHLSKKELSEVKRLARLSEGEFTGTFIANRTTHVIIKTDADLVCTRTLKYFQGISARIWIVSYSWVTACLKTGYFLPEEAYEVVGDDINGENHNGPKRARMWKKELLMHKYKICPVGEYTGLKKDELKLLVELCGATTVVNPTLVSPLSGQLLYIIVQEYSDREYYKGLYEQYKIPVISLEWVLDSISAYCIQPIEIYDLSGINEYIDLDNEEDNNEIHPGINNVPDTGSEFVSPIMQVTKNSVKCQNNDEHHTEHKKQKMYEVQQVDDKNLSNEKDENFSTASMNIPESKISSESSVSPVGKYIPDTGSQCVSAEMQMTKSSGKRKNEVELHKGHKKKKIYEVQLQQVDINLSNEEDENHSTASMNIPESKISSESSVSPVGKYIPDTESQCVSSEMQMTESKRKNEVEQHKGHKKQKINEVQLQQVDINFSNDESEHYTISSGSIYSPGVEISSESSVSSVIVKIKKDGSKYKKKHDKQTKHKKQKDKKHRKHKKNKREAIIELRNEDDVGAGYVSGCSKKHKKQKAYEHQSVINMKRDEDKVYLRCGVSATKCNKNEKHKKQKHSKHKKHKKHKKQKYNEVQLARRNNDGKRIWSKKDFCYFCGKADFKISRHWSIWHKHEILINEIESLPKLSKLKREKIAFLRNRGNLKNNFIVWESGQGKIVPRKRPRYNEEATEYLPCEFCSGSFKKGGLLKHQKSCSQRHGREKHRRVQSSANMMIPCRNSGEISDLLKTKVLSRMNFDSISAGVRKDDDILAYGSKMIKNHPEEHQALLVSQKMRDLAKLVLAVSVADPSITRIRDCINPNKFDTVVAAVKSVAQYSEETNSYKVPSYARNIGFEIDKIVAHLSSEAIKKGDKTLEDNVRSFKDVKLSEWRNEVTFLAHHTLQSRSRNKTNLIPLAEDLTKLAKYLQNAILEKTNLLRKNPTCPYEWQDLCQLALTRVSLFNKRRSGETERLLLDDYRKGYNKQGDDVPEEVYTSLTEVEKALVRKLLRIEVRGKRGRNVTILLTKEMVSTINLLNESRGTVGIAKENPYVFSRPFYGSVFPMRVSECYRKFSKESGAKNPDAVRSTKLRKHIAIMSQILCLQENELDLLASYMGHDLRIHREFYRLPENTLQLAKVSKLLIMMEQKMVSAYKGKNLDEIDISLDGSSDEENQENNQTDNEECSQIDDQEDNQIESKKPNQANNEEHNEGEKERDSDECNERDIQEDNQRNIQ